MSDLQQMCKKECRGWQEGDGRMRAIMVMYDSLNRKMLETYGCDWTITPNFKRLAERSVQFDNNFAGSLPCMPARRELHTGRVNFFHRSWGPMEPYDDSMPEILRRNGVYTHLVSDHQHYWEDGGATYHGRYSSWEISRGQEGDAWKADLSYRYDKATVFDSKRDKLNRPSYRIRVTQDAVNRSFMTKEEKTPQAVTFEAGLEFIERNHTADNWFLQIETFDPHEPFYSLPQDQALYPHVFAGDGELEADWPPYAPVTEDEDTVRHVRYRYAALVSKCDRYLGKVLDLMDRYDLWKDTMLIVNTDHGFLLGEHGFWGKSVMPVYDEIAHTPLYVYDPRMPEKVGIRRNALTQTVDIAPTLLEFFGIEIPEDMEGKPLRQVVERDSPIREYAIFGYFGSQVNITDGKYLYMHSAEHPEAPLYEYTLMPMHMRNMFSVKELQGMELSRPFRFTKGCRLMRIPGTALTGNTHSFGSALYNLKTVPEKDILPRKPEADENHLLEEPGTVVRMKEAIGAYMEKNDAPEEAYYRLGIPKKGEA
jgi:arylsulfatase A-like enzyme